MKHLCINLLIAILLICGSTYAQTPVGSPLGIDLGFGGGVSLPSGDLSNANNTGYHGLAKIRLHSFMPLSIVGSGMYSRLPEKVGSDADVYWMAGAGLEYPIPSAAVKPYFGVDVMFISVSNSGSGTSSFTRGGVGLGAGIEFSLPGVGSFDTSVKYQMLNVMGKDTNENTYSQVAASVALMFGVM